jgi:hypothetical protein
MNTSKRIQLPDVSTTEIIKLLFLYNKTAYHSNALSSYNKKQQVSIRRVSAHCCKSEGTVYLFVRYDMIFIYLNWISIRCQFTYSAGLKIFEDQSHLGVQIDEKTALQSFYTSQLLTIQQARTLDI